MHPHQRGADAADGLGIERWRAGLAANSVGSE
jgi:hypothetical protein